MGACHICGTELPGAERLCRDCYNYEYWRVTGPKPTFLETLGKGAGLGLLACLLALPLILGLYWVFTEGPAKAQRAITLFTSLLIWLFWRYALVDSRPQFKGRHQVFFWTLFAANAFFSLVFVLNGIAMWRWFTFATVLLVTIYLLIVRIAFSD